MERDRAGASRLRTGGRATGPRTAGRVGGGGRRERTTCPPWPRGVELAEIPQSGHWPTDSDAPEQWTWIVGSVDRVGADGARRMCTS